MNAAGLRYCTSCGTTLEPYAVTTTAQEPPALPGAIAPAKVVEIAAAAAGDPARTCPRCRGSVDAGAMFCKFCGASQATPGPPLVAGPGAPSPRYEPAPSPDIAPVHEQRPEPVRRPAAEREPRPMPLPMNGAVAQPPPAAAHPAPAGRPAEARGRLVVIAKSGADGPSYPIAESLDIGRNEGNIIVAEDPYLSPRHVRLLWKGDRLVLRDLASANGVYIRLSSVRDMRGDAQGRRHRQNDPPGEVAVPLDDKDLILVGQQVLRFEMLSEGEAGLGPAAEHGTLLFGSPVAPRYARLGQRTVEGVTRDVYYIRKLETVLGRESGDVVFTEDPFLSRRHAAIRLVAGDGSPLSSAPRSGDGVRFALVDLGSSNGTFLRIRRDVDLVSGDHFRVGQQLFRVDLDGARA